MMKPTERRDPLHAGDPAVGERRVTGTLKIYYYAHQITSSLQEMAIGLSQIISTQLEVSGGTVTRDGK
jgi:LytS/YehU family sensor histidine kinase